jgi:hypothetical protein
VIRRAAVDGWIRAEASPPPTEVEASADEVMVRDERQESLLARAYERGWNEGRVALAVEDDARRASDMERVARAERSLEEARAALVDLHGGLGAALEQHAATLEASAVTIAIAVAASLVRPMVVDTSLVASMCAQLAGEEGDATCLLEVSPLDRARLPETIRGVRVVAVEGMGRGRCVLRGPRGATHGDVLERMQAVVENFRDLATGTSP